MDNQKLLERFIELYGAEPEAHFHSPGRVNLIGEHTDYNGGYALPCALSFGTHGLVRVRDDRVVNLASTNFDLRISVSLDNIVYSKADDWGNYPKGVIAEFIALGHGSKLQGMDILISGDIPNASGLSSSASLELLIACMLNNLFGCGVEMSEMIRLSQRVENNFMGINSGIMDQYAVGMGRRGFATFINCRSITHEYVPLQLDGCKIVISNTKKRRGLADSKYNERRSECEHAVEELKKGGVAVELLGELSLEQFNLHKHLITNETIRKRAQHVIDEDARVLAAVESLKAGDIATFGRLINKSHDSLRDLYDVTGLELDTLVDEARKIEGTIGSRMTGAGFGGCTVSIVKDEAVERFKEQVANNYTAVTGLVPEFYIAESGDGPIRVN